MRSIAFQQVQKGVKIGLGAVLLYGLYRFLGKKEPAPSPIKISVQLISAETVQAETAGTMKLQFDGKNCRISVKIELIFNSLDGKEKLVIGSSPETVVNVPGSTVFNVTLSNTPVADPSKWENIGKMLVTLKGKTEAQIEMPIELNVPYSASINV